MCIRDRSLVYQLLTGGARRFCENLGMITLFRIMSVSYTHLYCLILGAYKQKQPAFSASYLVVLFGKRCDLPFLISKTSFTIITTMPTPPISMPISAFFCVGASGSLIVHHGVLYKQEIRALASGSQSFGHNLCPQGSLTSVSYTHLRIRVRFDCPQTLFFPYRHTSLCINSSRLCRDNTWPCTDNSRKNPAEMCIRDSLLV